MKKKKKKNFKASQPIKLVTRRQNMKYVSTRCPTKRSHLDGKQSKSRYVGVMYIMKWPKTGGWAFG